jgi:nucleotide-binding universal stress UspA family protein
VTDQEDQDHGSTLLLLPPPQEATRPVLALALRPDTEPWYLLEHAVDWAQHANAQLDLCAVIPSPSDPWGSYECSWQGMRQQLRRKVEVKRWLLTLHKAIPVQHRGTVTVLEGEVAAELASHAKTHSALLVGKSARRRWWSLFQATVASRLVHVCPIPVLVLAGRRPRKDVVVHMSEPPTAVGIHPLKWVSRHLPRSRVVVVGNRSPAVQPQRNSGVIQRLDFQRSSSATRHVGHRTTNPDTGHGLLASEKKDDVDLVVVPASKTLGVFQLFRGSLARTVLRSSACSVLVVPSSDAA